MPSEINYKTKYKELKLKFMNSIDIAFRLGYEAGAQQAQQQNTLDAQEQANAEKLQNKQLQSGEEHSHEEPEEGAPEENSSPEQGSELDQHISKLEGMLGSNSDPEIKKSIETILSLRKAEKESLELKKSQIAINEIAKALHKPAFKLGVQASHNLNDNAKKAVSDQHKIVNDLMKTWESEEKKAKNSLENILNIEGLLSKE